MGKVPLRASTARPGGSAMTKDSPNVIAFPPLILAGALGLAILLEWLVPFSLLPPPLTFWTSVLASVFAGTGGGLAVSAIFAFRRAGTNIEPYRPALHLVEAGPYVMTRNPMYLGLMALHVTITLIASLDWALVTLIPLALTLHYGVVLREEAYLTATFGQPYTEYCARTRRWI